MDNASALPTCPQRQQQKKTAVRNWSKITHTTSRRSRHERKAQSSLCRHPCAHRRRTTTANQGQGPATSARGGSLAHRRTQGVGREEILSRQPAGKDRPAHLGGYHQGAMDLRTGSPTAEGRTRSRSLRGTILARPSPPCAHDDDRVRLPPASPPCNCKAGKKESTGHR